MALRAFLTVLLMAAAALAATGPAQAQVSTGAAPDAATRPASGPETPGAASGALRIEITDGVAEPTRLAVAPFQDSGGAADLTGPLTQLIARDLTGTDLFTQMPEGQMPEGASDFDAPVVYDDWKAVQAEALVTGAVRVSGDTVTVRFRLFDIFADRPLGDGMQFTAPRADWRRTAHKVADQVYTRLTGEAPYFDSRIAFVGETGPRQDRQKRIGMMDSDGQNVKWLTDGTQLVLAPAFSPDGRKLLFTSFESGSPQVMLLDLASVTAHPVTRDPRAMAFAPRFSPDGRWIVYARESGGNTDIWQIDATSGVARALTDSPFINTSPDYAPDGQRIVFESDRSGTPQLYVMAADGSDARRISFGQGRYGTPVWSPKGDLIAFTKQIGARFHIGIMRPDGSAERLLTESHLDEGPTWAPNGRVVMFTRDTPGEGGQPRLHSVDITGRNMRPVAMESDASDPTWGPVLP